MIKSSLLSAAVLTGALVFVVNDVNAISFANVKITNIAYSFYDATPDDGIGFQIQEVDAYQISVVGQYGSHTGNPWSVYDFSLFQNSLVSGVQSVYFDASRSGLVSAEPSAVMASTRATGYAENTQSWISSFAFFGLSKIALSPGSGFTLSGVFSLDVGIDHDSRTDPTNFEQVSAFGEIQLSAVRYPQIDGVESHTSARESLGVNITSYGVTQNLDGSFGGDYKSLTVSPSRLHVSYENLSDSWDLLYFSWGVSAFSGSNLYAPPVSSPVPDGMNTALGGLLAFGVLAFVRRRG